MINTNKAEDIKLFFGGKEIKGLVDSSVNRTPRTTKVVILNSPPNGGKDSVANYLTKKNYEIYSHKEFKNKLFVLTKELFNISDERFDKIYNDRNLKERPLPDFTITRKAARVLSGVLPYLANELENNDPTRQDTSVFMLSVREAMIYVSEVVAKPTFGSDYFGKAAAANLTKGDINVFSDGGFVDELLPLIEEVGKENVMIIRIHREGCSFEGDSRDFLPDGLVTETYDINNDDTLEELCLYVEDLIREWEGE